jgi:hypothetical protein
MTIVRPITVSARHIVTTMSAQSSLSAGLFRSEVVAERSILDRTERGDQRRSHRWSTQGIGFGYSAGVTGRQFCNDFNVSWKF